MQHNAVGEEKQEEDEESKESGRASDLCKGGSNAAARDVCETRRPVSGLHGEEEGGWRAPETLHIKLVSR